MYINTNREDIAVVKWGEITFNVQVDRVADTVPLGVVGRTCVDSRIGPGHFLENEALIGNYDFFCHIVSQFSAIVSPCDFVWRRAGPDGALKIDVVTLLDIWGIETTS